MKDIELRAKLIRLGMPAAKADEVTRQIRDVIHPVAAVAAAKMRDHQLGMEQYAAYGDAGLSGYEQDGVSGLLKSVKKGLKKVAGVVAKAAPVLAIVPGVGTAAALAVGATAGIVKGKSSGAQYMKSGKAVGGVNYNTMTAGQLQSEAARLQTMIAAGKDKKDASRKLANVQGLLNSAGMAAVVPESPLQSSPKTPPAQNMPPETLSEKIGRQRRVKVPKPLANTAGQIAAQALEQNYPADTTALITAMLQNQGTGMASAQARDVVAQVAEQGVEQTDAGPSALPKWALPAAGAAVLLLIMSRRKRA